MSSPFPGMNPYLERQAVWDSFHPNFIAVAHFQLSVQVRPKYFVRTESRLYIHEPPADRRFVGSSDLDIRLPTGRSGPTSGVPAAVIAPAYVTIPEPVEVQRVGYLSIRAREGDEVVTVVELLSRSNKYTGPDRDQYLTKRRELLRSPAHLVEIDLLRGGPRMPPDDLPTCDYCAVVSRVAERPRAGVWPWRLREPLPEIPIPLRDGDPDAKLNLKAVIDQVYDLGGYDSIYDHPTEPRLAPADAAWASQFIPPATPR